VRGASVSRLGAWTAAWLIAAGTTIAAPPAPARKPAERAASAKTDQPVLRLRREKGGPSRVEAAGLSREAIAALSAGAIDRRRGEKILAVYVANGRGDVPPVIGDYALDGDVLAFTPRFPLRPGVKYRVRLNSAALGSSSGRPSVIERVLSLPAAPSAAPAKVTGVYPSGDVLPENLLKFYIHFSAPMSRGESYRRLRLLDESGAVVPDPFLELGEELWNAEGTRFTLLFDPGRIKRGLKPREEAGAVFVEGRRYTLVVDAAWRDAQGNALVGELRKEFRVVAADGSQPDPRRWKIALPSAATREPLVVTFDEPLDHAMLQRVLEVVDDKGQPLDGSIIVDRDETRWLFTPEHPWSAGRFSLQFDETLEDRAGNSVGRAFEVDSSGPVGEPRQAPQSLPFEIE
jgi:hypothetical protein